MTGDKAWNELLDLDKNVTLEQLEEKGYISDKDGVVTVTLKNIQNPTVPAEEILQDEKLYKWKN